HLRRSREPSRNRGPYGEGGGDATSTCSTWRSTASAGASTSFGSKSKTCTLPGESGSSDGDPEEDQPAGAVRNHRANPKRSRRVAVQRCCKKGKKPLSEPFP